MGKWNKKDPSHGCRKVPGGAPNRGHKQGLGALKKGSAFKYSAASTKPGRTAPDGEKNKKHSHYRSEGTIRRLKMYMQKAPSRESMQKQSTKPMRIQPDRRWFGNTRIIAQQKMQVFRETLAKKVHDPYSVVLLSSKLPMSFLKDTDGKASRMNLLSIEPFKETFGPKAQRKRPKLDNYDFDGMAEAVEGKAKTYSESNKDTQLKADPLNLSVTEAKLPYEEFGHRSEDVFNKGTSKRIWKELYKVLDSADVLVFVLDARDPEGTRCRQVEQEIRKNRPNKHIVLLLNKVDLIPTWATRRWVQYLTKEYPTLAFHASITNPFGKSALINLLRQLSNLLKERQHVTVGMIGYPNVGKSSVINTMRKKTVCKAAPVPGETKVWQYITLSKRIYLLDCPGIVPPSEEDFHADCAKVLKGVVRAEKISNPSDYIPEVLSRVKKIYLIQRYRLPLDTTWTDHEDFLTVLSHKMGKIKKGGEADIEVTARIMLYDWQRGRLPFFTPPPGEKDKSENDKDNPDDKEELKAKAPVAIKDGTDQDASEKPASDELDEVAEAVKNIQLRQSLAELSCTVEYDEEDRHGDAQEPSVEQREQRKRKATKDKRRKRRKVVKLGKAGAGKQKVGQTAVPGSLDWKAVVAEFGL